MRQGKLGEEEMNPLRCSPLILTQWLLGYIWLQAGAWTGDQRPKKRSPPTNASVILHASVKPALSCHCPGSWLNWIAQMVWISTTRSYQPHYQYQMCDCSKLPSTCLSRLPAALKLQGRKFYLLKAHSSE